MKFHPPNGEQPHGAMLKEFTELRSLSASPAEFWQRYLDSLACLTRASKTIVLVPDAARPGQWKRFAEWPAALPPSRFLTAFSRQIEVAASYCTQHGEGFVAALEDGTVQLENHFVLAVPLKVHQQSQKSVATLLLSEVHENSARESLVRLCLAADVPESYQMHQATIQSHALVGRLATALELMTAVNAEKRFLAAALAFCNGLTTICRCERVSLGWLEAGYIRLRAISRTEKFDRKMNLTAALEKAMEETLDQDEEILWPPPQNASFVSRDHQSFATQPASSTHLCSFPLRLDGKNLAVVMCERAAASFEGSELQQLRLCCDQATRRLADLHHRDRWFGARLAAWLKDCLAVVVGPRHTWAKVTSLLSVILLAVLFLVRVPYRVEANFVLKSDDTSFRTAPFDGYIEQVFVRPGDLVKAGDKLLKLATRELELEESAAMADLGRFQREAEKSRATGALADMRVAIAIADQAKARLELVRYRLGEATLKAPFTGVVVEGDLRERLAAPVKQGDSLVKIARIENLYAEAEVNERDIHEILARKTGEIAFLSQPKLKFPVSIVKVEPAAFPRSEGNVFLVRRDFEHSPEQWWRPGMSGLCKLSVEPRTLWWIFTHRTVDFVRMKLWW